MKTSAARIGRRIRIAAVSASLPMSIDLLPTADPHRVADSLPAHVAEFLLGVYGNPHPRAASVAPELLSAARAWGVITNSGRMAAPSKLGGHVARILRKRVALERAGRAPEPYAKRLHMRW